MKRILNSHDDHALKNGMDVEDDLLSWAQSGIGECSVYALFDQCQLLACRDDLNEVCRKGNSNQLKVILERVKAERKHCEPLLNLQYRVSYCTPHTRDWSWCPDNEKL